MGSVTSTPFPTERHLYYALARGLNRGYTPPPGSSLSSAPSRPALPVELVLDIFNLAGILQPNPTKSIAVHSRGACDIVSLGHQAEKLFFHSGPLSRQFLAHVRQMRLRTVSKDQGWTSDRGGGSWSWFEVGILQPMGATELQDGVDIIELDFPVSEVPHGKCGGDDGRHSEGALWDHGIDGNMGSQQAAIQREAGGTEIEDGEFEDVQERQSIELEFNLLDEAPNIPDDPIPPDGTNEDAPKKFKYHVKHYPEDANKPLRWKSHHNVLASFSLVTQDGEIFGPDHELWRYLTEGDVIAVYACALYPMWQNDARSGTLEFWEKFNPMGLESGQKEEIHTEEY